MSGNWQRNWRRDISAYYSRFDYASSNNFTYSREIKPWLSSYPDELHKAIELGEKAAEKLNYPLPVKLNVAASVVYQDAECGQLVQYVGIVSVTLFVLIDGWPVL